MANTEPEKIFVNTLMDADLVAKLDSMVEENESTRSQYIRLLIKRQWEERERNEAQKKISLLTSASSTKRSNRVPA